MTDPIPAQTLRRLDDFFAELKDYCLTGTLDDRTALLKVAADFVGEHISYSLEFALRWMAKYQRFPIQVGKRRPNFCWEQSLQCMRPLESLDSWYLPLPIYRASFIRTSRYPKRWQSFSMGDAIGWLDNSLDILRRLLYGGLREHELCIG